MIHAILAFLALFSFFSPQSAFAYRDEVSDRPNVFTHYKPTYFIVGNPDTKIQISLKMQPLEGSTFYIGYSQIMIWELRKPSDPMKDINYAPELFYRWHMGGNSPTEWVDFGFIEHESNGRDSWESRSWNRTYVRYFREFSLGTVKLDASFRAWVPYGYDETSDQLPQYRGIYEGVFTLSHFFGGMMSESDFTFRFWGGGSTYLNPGQGGQEATLRLKFWGEKFLPSFVAQVFNGYGQYLLDADQKQFSWRIGIGF